MIVGGEVRPFRLRLRAPLETGAGLIEVREGVLLVLHDSEGRRGLGEAAPIPGLPAFAHEEARSCGDVLMCSIPHLEGRSPEEVDDLLERVERCHPASRFALESALVDLAAQARGVRVADWLAGGHAPHTKVPVNALVTGADPEEVRVVAEGAIARGFGTFKLKVGIRGLAEDAKRVAALRNAIGTRARIRLDANGAWSRDEALRAIAELSRFTIEYIEDPIRIRTLEDVAILAELRAASSIPLGADDCVADPVLVREIIARKAADVLILKPSCLGGLAAARAVARAAWARGMRAVVTSSIDSAVGVMATLHLAASLEGDLAACGLATASLLAEDVATPPAIDRGVMTLPSEPGLGVVLREGPE